MTNKCSQDYAALQKKYNAIQHKYTIQTDAVNSMTKINNSFIVSYNQNFVIFARSSFPQFEESR